MVTFFRFKQHTMDKETGAWGVAVWSGRLMPHTRWPGVWGIQCMETLSDEACVCVLVCVCEWRRPVFIQAVLKWPAQRRRWGQRVSAYLPLQPRSLFRTERGQSRSEFQSPNAAYCTLTLASSTRYRRCLEEGEYVRVLYTGADHHDQSG